MKVGWIPCTVSISEVVLDVSHSFMSMLKLTIVDVAVVVFETSHNGTVRL